MEKLVLTPPEVAVAFEDIGVMKTGLRPWVQFVLAVLAGAFIAFAAQGSSVAVHTVESVGLSKMLAGLIFPAGLVFVIIAGAELFTGNCLLIITYLRRKITLAAMLRSWGVVYLGNLAGALLIASLIYLSGQLNFTGGALGGAVVKTAVYKANLPFLECFIMGVLCNWLVCLAVWMAVASRTVTGKILAIFFPIWLFITSGFEHSVANMYYIPAGILAKLNPAWADAAVKLGADAAKVDALGVSGFLANLVPVTLGNFIGGALFVGAAYWFAYLKNE